MLCEQCETFTCKVCGHEACPVCETSCDNPACIIWDAKGRGKDSHACVFDPCPNGCVRDGKGEDE